MAIETVLVLVLCLSIAVSSGDKRFLYQDASASPRDRAADLMARMTLVERTHQLYSVHNYHAGVMEMYANTSFGALKLSSFNVPDPKLLVAQRNELQAQIINTSRLSIPLSWPQETLNSAGPNAVIFPLPIALGCSFNATLVEAIHAVIASEARATGVDVGYSPEINLYVDPRFGRIQEAFSEDPFLTSTLGVAAVRGLQGASSFPGTYLQGSKIAALAKHWVAYGDSPMNAMGADMSERRFRDVFLRPWKAVIAEGLRGLMPSHQLLFDVPVHGNAWLGQAVLRKELNFTGISVSDCSDIGALMFWGVAQDEMQTAIQGIEAGVDMENQCATNPDGGYSYWHLSDAVQQQYVSEAYVNASCARVLEHKFASGLFDTPFTDPAAVSQLNNASSKALALEAARQGIVLLKNDDALLPLDVQSFKRIALIGESAACFDDKHDVSGDDNDLCNAQRNYIGKILHVPGAAANSTITTVAQEAAVRFPTIKWTSAIGSPIDTSASTEDIAEAVAAAQDSNLVVAVMGDSIKSCAEFGDRDTLDLPSNQLEVLSRLLDTGKPVVLVLINGRPATFWYNGTNLLDRLRTVVVAWRPGQATAGAVWDVLSGVVEPVGRLSQSWPRSVGQVGGPANPWMQKINGKWNMNHRGKQFPDTNYPFNPFVDDESTPLFPFGAGIGYAQAKILSLGIVPQSSQGDVAFIAQVNVTAPSSTTALVQIYISTPATNLVRYWRRLVGFAQVAIPGHAVSVAIPVQEADLMTFFSSEPGSPQAGTLVLAEGTFNVYAAFNATGFDQAAIYTTTLQ